jgi:hypothetical protein
MLIAADLNQPTLAGGYPRAFARLLTSQQRRFFNNHLDRTAHGGTRDTRNWVASFAPGSVQFNGNVIKVHGTMHARTASDQGRQVLRVRLDYLFVYAVVRPSPPLARTRVVLRDTGWIEFGHLTRLTGQLQPWWSVTGGATPTPCGGSGGFLNVVFPGTSPGGTPPSGAPVDPYNQYVPPPSGCHPATRT